MIAGALLRAIRRVGLASARWRGFDVDTTTTVFINDGAFGAYCQAT